MEKQKKVAKKTTKKSAPEEKQNFEMVVVSKAVRELLGATTPDVFIKKRQGKGSRTFTYVSIGYVIAMLNKCFTPFNWDFEVLEEKILDKEVIVKGRLTIKNFETGYTVSKTQYGMKEIITSNNSSFKMPIGDALKSATSDCIKKCASLFGIASDVYWEDADVLGEESKNKTKAKTKVQAQKEASSFEKAIRGIKQQEDMSILQQIKDRIPESKLYSKEEKEKMLELIDAKLFADEN